MTAVVSPELFPVAKKRKDHPATPAFDRVEFQAEPGWVVHLDKVAASFGLSRSAYIRLACNRQMESDRRPYSFEHEEG